MNSNQELTVEAKLELAMDLLGRVAEYHEEDPPDGQWFREYFILTGQHAIMTEDGWESGDSKAAYLEDDPDWKPLDEVNAPKNTGV